MHQIRDTRYKIRKIIIAQILISLMWISIAHAATLSLSGTESAVVNQPLVVEVSLITIGEQINAVEAEILYERDKLRLEAIREDASVVGLWLMRPQKVEEGKITFSGVIPGGNPSATSPLVVLIFKPITTGTGRIWFKNARAFLNDGAGTEAPLSYVEYNGTFKEESLEFLQQPGIEESVLLPADREPPEEFVPILGKDETVFEGKWFLAFWAIDRGTGIDHYEVLESTHEIRDARYKEEENWIVAESPHVLQNQFLSSYLYVKAVDRAGNERVAVVEPQKNITQYVWITLGVIALLIVIRWKYKF